MAPAGTRERPERLYRIVLVLLDALTRVLFRLEVAGAHHVPRRGPVLIVANHVSFLDPCVLAVVAHRSERTLRFVALADLFARPVLGWELRKGGMIPVARGRAASEMLGRASSALDAGEAVLIYPEGTIPSDGAVVPARRGAGVLALTTAAPVIAVGSSGLERRGRRVPPLRRRAAVVWGAPLEVDVLRAEQGRAAERAAAEMLGAGVRACASEARRLVEARGESTRRA
jgi:1-acyl-sn-glycerol-3-phosphate acyltransferase